MFKVSDETLYRDYGQMSLLEILSPIDPQKKAKFWDTLVWRNFLCQKNAIFGHFRPLSLHQIS